MRYPEHEKLMAISEKSQAIGDFLAWLEEGGLGEEIGSVEMAQYGRHQIDLMPLGMPKTDLLARYFDIDLSKIEDEKRAMIAALQPGEGAPA